MRLLRPISSLCLAAALLAVPLPAHAGSRIPGWAKPAVRHLVNEGWIERTEFRANKPLTRARFKALMEDAFGGGYRRARGKVRAAEVSRALVRALGREKVAQVLAAATSPDGWSPTRAEYFGYEIAAREMGLRHDRPTSEDRFEAAAAEPMTQADVAWAVWKAKTAPSTHAADALADFAFADYDPARRKVVQYALSLVGTPYVWAGEWPVATPSGYPYGDQVHGGFDCSGFVWYVLRAKESSYSPMSRPYAGWPLAERSSAEMAKATPRKKRLGYRKLLAGDVVLFAPNGTDSRPADVYHAGIYLGDGWMIHSSGSRAGVSISPIGPGTWWRDQIIFGRRVITE